MEPGPLGFADINWFFFSFAGRLPARRLPFRGKEQKFPGNTYGSETSRYMYFAPITGRHDSLARDHAASGVHFPYNL